jgi:hypothetical protein
MPGLDPGIQNFLKTSKYRLDRRVKPGDEGN